MEKHYQSAKAYVADHKKEFVTGTSIVVAVALILFGLALYSYNQPKQVALVYEPAVACNLLTLDEARELLGPLTIGAVSEDPVQTGVITTSECAYSDGQADTANARVAAIKVRTGINDDGIKLNDAQFDSGKPTRDVEIVKDLGDSAYFDKSTGQLNILKQSTWIIISYGTNGQAANNTLEDALTIAKKVIN